MRSERTVPVIHGRLSEAMNDRSELSEARLRRCRAGDTSARSGEGAHHPGSAELSGRRAARRLDASVLKVHDGRAGLLLCAWRRWIARWSSLRPGASSARAAARGRYGMLGGSVMGGGLRKLGVATGRPVSTWAETTRSAGCRNPTRGTSCGRGGPGFNDATEILRVARLLSVECATRRQTELARRLGAYAAPAQGDGYCGNWDHEWGPRRALPNRRSRMPPRRSIRVRQPARRPNGARQHTA